MREKLELVPNLDELVEEHKLINESQMNHIKMLQSEPQVNFKISSKFSLNNETGFKLNLFSIEANLTELIIKANKRNKTKLTAYLTTVAFYSLNNLYIENNIQIPKGNRKEFLAFIFEQTTLNF